MGKFVVKTTKTGIEFDLKTGNEETVLTSKVFTSKNACQNGIESVKRNVSIAAIENQTVKGYTTEKHPKFVVFKDKSSYRFSLKATNGQVIASSKNYKTIKSCLDSIELVKKNAPEASIVAAEESAEVKDTKDTKTKKAAKDTKKTAAKVTETKDAKKTTKAKNTAKAVSEAAEAKDTKEVKAKKETKAKKTAEVETKKEATAKTKKATEAETKKTTPKAKKTTEAETKNTKPQAKKRSA